MLGNNICTLIPGGHFKHDLDVSSGIPGEIVEVLSPK